MSEPQTVTIPFRSNETTPSLSLDPQAPQWQGISPLWVETPAGPSPHAGKGHFPRVSVRFRAEAESFCLLFCVEDEEGVQAVEHTPNGSVWLDSTVEFFFRPAGETRYINLEMNCLGIPHASLVSDWRRDPETRVLCGRTMMPESLLSRITIITSIPDLPCTREGRPGKTSWQLAVRLPYDVISDLFGRTLRPAPGAVWFANFQKCADKSAHPHWLSWSPLPKLNFHDPDHFGRLLFD